MKRANGGPRSIEACSRVVEAMLFKQRHTKLPAEAQADGAAPHAEPLEEENAESDGEDTDVRRVCAVSGVVSLYITTVVLRCLASKLHYRRKHRVCRSWMYTLYLWVVAVGVASGSARCSPLTSQSTSRDDHKCWDTTRSSILVEASWSLMRAALSCACSPRGEESRNESREARIQ